jgi:hypothetical protein
MRNAIEIDALAVAICSIDALASETDCRRYPILGSLFMGWDYVGRVESASMADGRFIGNKGAESGAKCNRI